MNSPRSSSRRGGFIALLGLLVVVAIMFALYFAGGNKSYVKTVVDSKEHAKVEVSRVDLQNLHKDLQMMALTGDGTFPTRSALLDGSSIASSLDTQAEAAGGKFVYIEGQKDTMPPSNILVYVTRAENQPVMVLRLAGTVEDLPAAQLPGELKKTQSSIH